MGDRASARVAVTAVLATAAFITSPAAAADPVLPEPVPASAVAPAPASGPKRCAKPDEQGCRKPHVVRRSDVGDYLISASTLAVGLTISRAARPNSQPLIGHTFDRARPNEVLNPLYADDIGKRFATKDTIPAWIVLPIGVGVGALLALPAALDMKPAALRESADPFDLGRKRYAHDLFVGYAEALSFNTLATEWLKRSVGRLRPDFQDRVRLYLACAPAKIAECQSTLEDGQLSFPSGHASYSFAIATYGSLALGGRFLWGDRATLGTGLAAGAGMLALNTGAMLIGMSRVMDHRHRGSDVFAGMLVGMLSAHLAYFRRFDLHGNPRKPAETDFEVAAGPGDVGLALAKRW